MASDVSLAIEKISRLLRNRFPSGYITRFAPSPTGYLHLGHIASMLIIEEVCSKSGGSAILRIEDHDQSRAKQKFTKAIIEDLNYLGFSFANADSFRDINKISKDYCQSKKSERYFKKLEQLHTQRQLYHCNCTRLQIQNRLKSSPSRSLLYDNKCRREKSMGYEEFISKAKKNEFAIRYLIPSDKNQKMNEDPFQTDIPAPYLTASKYGDFVVFDKNNNFSYQFATVCDDIDQQINVVIRGQDLQDSTTRQISLHKSLGNTNIPEYFHHPLIYDDDGKKLSKRFLSTSVRDLLISQKKPSEIRKIALNLIKGRPQKDVVT